MSELVINVYKDKLEKIKQIVLLKEDSLMKNTILKNIDEVDNLISKYSTLKDFILNDNLNIAFVGQVGVGKSSIISSLLPKIKLNNEELFETKKIADEKIKEKISNDKFLKKSALLPIGDGRTTLANITIYLNKNIKDYYIAVEMMNKDEVEEIIDNYLEYFSLKSKERKNFQLMPSELRSYLYHKALKKFVLENIDKSLKKREQMEEAFKKYLSSHSKKRIKRELLKIIFEKIDNNFSTIKKIKYSDKNFNALFSKKALYKEYIKEDTENKKRRFIKKILKKINNGNLSFITIPKNIRLFIPANFNLTILDTKGSEKYNKNSQLRDSFYVNTQIEALAKNDNIITIFVSGLEDAPSFDIKEIFAESSLKEKFIYKSGMLISLKKDIDYETYEKKKSDCMAEMEELKNYIGFYNAYLNLFEDPPKLAFTNESFLDFVHKINGKRILYLEQQKKDILKTIEDKIYLFQNALTEKEYKEIEKLTEFIKNEKVSIVNSLNKKLKNISLEIIEMMEQTHHSIIYAMTKRYGQYSGFDLISYMRVKADNYIEALYEILNKKTNDELKKKRLKKELKEKVNQIFKSFFINEEYNLKEITYQYVDNFKNDSLFWEKNISEWGKGIGYKHRVVSHFKNKTEFINFQKFIEEEFKKAVIFKVLDNFIPLFEDEKEKECLLSK